MRHLTRITIFRKPNFSVFRIFQLSRNGFYTAIGATRERYPLRPEKIQKNVGGKLKQKKRYGGGEGGVEQQKH